MLWWPRWRAFGAALATGLAGAAICLWLHTPLPWMIGPLFATAALRLAGRELACPVRVREAGQWAIGTALGLYFTAPVLAVLLDFTPWIAGAVLFALALGACGAMLLRRLSGVDSATAFFAMAVGGASEMASMLSASSRTKGKVSIICCLIRSYTMLGLTRSNT
ncbi:AbrB family transcriptional regulator, partial [Janthinobacterium sp. AD80]|uniref:AbrB family transcriptional regulator n=1 Tax=Janthinobacterium sp. AD80 TaxID=1528773 RepID=UPI002155D5E6